MAHSSSDATIEASDELNVEDSSDVPTVGLIHKNTVPIPNLVWTNNERFWKVMCGKDDQSVSSRNPLLFSYQDSITPKMRAILLEWISEVADVFHLNRETYYLSIDYIDRYLTKVPSVKKQNLQLLGTTALFVASKMEEIYPPKLDAFANMTDGACTQEAILDMESILVQHLDWILIPMTINGWLEMFLQFIYKDSEKTEPDDFVIPKFSGALLSQLFRLTDLILLDATNLTFSYGVLSTTALYILVGPEIALRLSGLTFKMIEPCVQWMSVYRKVLDSSLTEEGSLNLKDYPVEPVKQHISKNNARIHVHTTKFELYKRASIQLEIANCQNEYTESTTTNLVTPPSLSKNSPTGKRVRTQSSDSSSKNSFHKRARKCILPKLTKCRNHRGPTTTHRHNRRTM